MMREMMRETDESLYIRYLPENRGNRLIEKQVQHDSYAGFLADLGDEREMREANDI